MNVIKKYKYAIAAVFLVMLTYALGFVFGITCPIKFLFGISCPGCGMTRAFLSVCRLDFAKAFYYHPLWICVVPALITLLLLAKRKKTKAFKIFSGVCVIIMLAVYFYRITESSDVVVFNFRDGMIYKAFEFIRSQISSIFTKGA